jgi:5-methylcytosine-specific restriction enzyme A
MPLRDTLQRIIADYPSARTQPFASHPLATFIRREAAQEVDNALGTLGTGLIVEGSAGAGNWAAVPWISVFDPAITTSATDGYYVVYLFQSEQPIVHLSLNQGTTTVREEFGARAREVLRDRADLMRKRITDFSNSLPINPIDLGSNARLPGDYVAGHAIGASYEMTTLPDEATLQADLQNCVRAYRALTYRGGTDAEAGSQSELQEEFGIAPGASVIETRKYVYHRKIERNATAVKQAKKFHGTRCQSCDLEFSERYGEIGEGFIEAHHLRLLPRLRKASPSNMT